jgi:biopolymer transport protein ExbD
VDELSSHTTQLYTTTGHLTSFLAKVLNKEPITLHEIGQRVQAGLMKDPELFAVINADDHALHGTIVDIMDKVRLAGVSHLAIAVKPERGGTP